MWPKHMLDVYPHAVWLNPTQEERWGYYESFGRVRQLMAERMFALTLDGLDRAMHALAR